mmetsp:Transcript_41087/g.63275  ORF Transcript_41087/g.63275 Transcript_41087/m.63275 type:complete len:236 (+) Transcript_41087:29-736(+)
MLEELWSECLTLWDNIEQSSLRGDSQEFKDLLQECQEKFQQLGQKVNELCLFSTNETIQDIQTAYLPFILLPFYLALIEQKKMENRKHHLNNSKLFFGNFISVCDNFELLSSDERKQAEKEAEVKDRRADLIARARKEKEVNDRIEYLTKKKAEIVKTRGTDAYEGSDEEENERALYLTKIKQAVLRTFNEIRMIEQELPMLDHLEAMKRGEVEPAAPPPPKKKSSTSNYFVSGS